MWNISPAFRAAIQSPVHTMTVKAQVLDTDFNVVEGGTFYDTGRTDGISVPGVSEDDPQWLDHLMGNRRSGSIQNYIVDGQVDADAERGARRSLTLSLMNPEAEFTPRSDWGGLFYVNRLIRVWRGVIYEDGREELVPIGTFMIDTADVVAERNMSIVAITGSDLWKMLGKTQFGTPIHFAAGTDMQYIIQEMAEMAGVTRFIMDDLSHRNPSEQVSSGNINFERGAVIGDELLKLATAWGLDVYFDPLGRMVSEESRLNRTSVWTFDTTSDLTVLTAKASYKDESLFNHIVVTGTADEQNPVHAIAFDDDPTSPTYYLRIGKRTLMYESKYIGTTARAQEVADILLEQRTNVTEDIELQTMTNPAWECNDVVTIREPTFTKLNQRVRIKAFSVPLSSSRQSIRLRRMVLV